MPAARSSLAEPAVRRAPSPRRGVRALALSFAVILLAVVVPGPAAAHDSDTTQVRVSATASRTSSTPLGGATVRDVIYPFIPADASIRMVEFWLDNPGMAGAPRQVEREAPFDLAGGTVAVARPFDTKNLSEGSHTLTARITRSDGHVASGETYFTVDNVADSIPEPAGEVRRWNTGGSAVTVGGARWAADAHFAGGKSYTNSKVTAIGGTTDDALYLTERSAAANLGGFGYAIPAPVAGSYTVTLHFAEIYHGATGGGPGGVGKRVFSANFEGGSAELVDFDIFATAGAMTATQKTFTVPVTDGQLNIAFTATVDQPSVSAITVVSPADSTTPPPDGPPPSWTGDPTAFGWDNRAAAPLGRSEGQGASVGGKVYVFGGFDVGTTTTRSDVSDTVTNS